MAGYLAPSGTSGYLALPGLSGGWYVDGTTLTAGGTLEMGANTITGTREWKLDLGGDGAGSEKEYLTSTADSTVNIYAAGTNRFTISSTALTAYKPLIVRDDNTLRLGSGSGDAHLVWDTDQTNHGLLFGLGNTSNYAVLCQTADMGFDFAHGNQTNSTLFVHSANQATDEWVSIAHDQTDGVIDSGKGTLNLGATGNVNFAGATATGATVTHDAYVELEVGGTTKKFMLGS